MQMYRSDEEICCHKEYLVMCYGWAFGLGAMRLVSTSNLRHMMVSCGEYYVCTIRSHKYNIRVEGFEKLMWREL